MSLLIVPFIDISNCYITSYNPWKSLIMTGYSCVFQKNDGVPIHLKGGPVDKVLYGITLALCAVGTVLSLQTLFVMAYPKKA